MGQEMAFTKLNYVPPKLRSITYFSNFRPFLLYDDPKDVSSPYCFSKCCHHHRARISNVQGRWLSRDSYICALPNLDTQTIWHRQSSFTLVRQSLPCWWGPRNVISSNGWGKKEGLVNIWPVSSTAFHESFQTMEPASQTEYLLVPKEHHIPASHQTIIVTAASVSQWILSGAMVVFTWISGSLPYQVYTSLFS